MNLTTITRSIAILPDLVREVARFAAWDHHELMSRLSFEDGHDHDFDDEEGDPLSHSEAGRIALEFVMIGRMSRHDPGQFHSMMEAALPSVDSPQHAVDVIMSLAGMVSALAEDEDLAHFGEHILAAEVGGH